MGLIKKKKKKKLTTDQLISRWSTVIFVVLMLVGLFFTFRDTLEDFEESTIGNSNVFEYLNESFYPDTLIATPVSTEDKTAVKTKTTDAGLDLFKNNYMTRDKYTNVGNANDFSLTANESAFFANEILAISQNKYGIDYNEINITNTNDEVVLKFVASVKFGTFCGYSSNDSDLYKNLGITIPQVVYLTSFVTVNGESVTYQCSFNALNNDKNKDVMSYMNKQNSTDKIEELCYKTFTSILSDFGTRTNTTYSFSSGYVNFQSTLGS